MIATASNVIFVFCLQYLFSYNIALCRYFVKLSFGKLAIKRFETSYTWIWVTPCANYIFEVGFYQNAGRLANFCPTCNSVVVSLLVVFSLIVTCSAYNTIIWIIVNLWLHCYVRNTVFRQCSIGLDVEEKSNFYNKVLPTIMQCELHLARKLQNRYIKTSDVSACIKF